MKGYIKIHRELLDWKYKTNPKMVALWLELLLRAKYEISEDKYGNKLLPGQLSTGRVQLATATGLTERQVRLGLDMLEKCRQICRERKHKCSIITIVNWEDYQASGQKDCRKVAEKGPHYKKLKEIKKYIYLPEFEEALDYWNSKQIIVHEHPTALTKRANTLFIRRKKTYSLVDIQKAMDNYARVLASESYFKYKWGLDQFLGRENALSFYPDRFQEGNYIKGRKELRKVW